MQQILSMSHGPEKVQQVQQQQPDTQGRQFAAEFREVVDIQKNRVREAEQGNPSHQVEDKKERGGKGQAGSGGKQRKPVKAAAPEPGVHLEEINQGKILDITI